MKKRKLLERSFMTTLFIMAIYVTWSELSQLHFEEWLQNREEELVPYVSLMNEERGQAVMKAVDNVPLSQTVAALEQGVDWSKYPTVNVVATGYTAGVESTGKTADHPAYGITYSGLPVSRGVYSTIAADPDYFPLGTVMFIPGYGYGVVADTGSAIRGHTIDLYFNTVNDVYEQWGKKHVEVFVVQEGTGEITPEELASLNEGEALEVLSSSRL